VASGVVDNAAVKVGCISGITRGEFIALFSNSATPCDDTGEIGDGSIPAGNNDMLLVLCDCVPLTDAAGTSVSFA